MKVLPTINCLTCQQKSEIIKFDEMQSNKTFKVGDKVIDACTGVPAKVYGVYEPLDVRNPCQPTQVAPSTDVDNSNTHLTYCLEYGAKRTVAYAPYPNDPLPHGRPLYSDNFLGFNSPANVNWAQLVKVVDDKKVKFGSARDYSNTNGGNLHTSEFETRGALVCQKDKKRRHRNKSKSHDSDESHSDSSSEDEHDRITKKSIHNTFDHIKGAVQLNQEFAVESASSASALCFNIALGAKSSGTEKHKKRRDRGDADSADSDDEECENDFRIAHGGAFFVDRESGVEFGFALTNDNIYAVYSKYPRSDDFKQHKTELWSWVKSVGTRSAHQTSRCEVQYHPKKNQVVWILDDVEVAVMGSIGRLPADRLHLVRRQGKKHAAVVKPIQRLSFVLKNCNMLDAVDIWHSGDVEKAGHALCDLTGLKAANPMRPDMSVEYSTSLEKLYQRDCPDFSEPRNKKKNPHKWNIPQYGPDVCFNLFFQDLAITNKF